MKQFKLVDNAIATTFTRTAAARQAREVLQKNLGLTGVPTQSEIKKLMRGNRTMPACALGVWVKAK